MHLPSVPWQLTGNHWLTLPCINPTDGAIHALGVLHRGARAAIEFAGSPAFMSGNGTPLLGPVVRVNGVVRVLAAEGIAWERSVGWLPTFTCTIGTLVVRGTIFAPYGRDADMAGAVYTFAVENRGDAEVELEIALEGALGHRQQRVRTPRPFDDEHLVSVGPDEVLLLEGAAIPGLAAIAIGSDGPATIEAPSEPSREPRPFALRRALVVPANGAVQLAFYIAVGPERAAAHAVEPLRPGRGPVVLEHRAPDGGGRRRGGQRR